MRPRGRPLQSRLWSGCAIQEHHCVLEGVGGGRLGCPSRSSSGSWCWWSVGSAWDLVGVLGTWGSDFRKWLPAWASHWTGGLRSNWSHCLAAWFWDQCSLSSCSYLTPLMLKNLHLRWPDGWPCLFVCSFIHSFIHSFNKYLLASLSTPGTALGTGNRPMNKSGRLVKVPLQRWPLSQDLKWGKEGFQEDIPEERTSGWGHSSEKALRQGHAWSVCRQRGRMTGVQVKLEESMGRRVWGGERGRASISHCWDCGFHCKWVGGPVGALEERNDLIWLLTVHVVTMK